MDRDHNQRTIPPAPEGAREQTNVPADIAHAQRENPARQGAVNQQTGQPMPAPPARPNQAAPNTAPAYVPASAVNDDAPPPQPAPSEDIGNAERIRAERYQRYLRDLRAHERANETGETPPAAAPQASAPPVRRPESVPAAATEALGVGRPDPGQPVERVPDSDVDQTIEQYLERTRQEAKAQQILRQEAAQDASQSQAGAVLQPGAAAANDQTAAAAPMPPLRDDEWPDDVQSDYVEQSDLYADNVPAAAPRPKRRGIKLFAGLVVVLLLGGAIVFAYQQGLQGGDGDNLPVIQADKAPSKVPPKDPGGTSVPQQTKLIYDRIVGEEIVVRERIVPREEQIAATPVTPEVQTSEPERAVPEGQLPELPVQIVPASPGPGVEPSLQQTVTPGNVPAAQLPKVVITPPGSAPPTPANIPAASPPPVALAPVQPRAPSLPAATPPAQVGPAAAAPPTPRIKPRIPTPVRQANRPGNAPIRLTPATPPAATPPARLSAAPAATPTPPRAIAPAPPRAAPKTASRQVTAPAPPAANPNAYIVQVASYRSENEAQAAFGRLKQKHSRLVGSYQPLIQRADLGARGIYYRLRVGPIDGKARANDLCQSLRSAGQKACLVRPL